MISGRPRHGAFPVPGELQEDVSTVRAALQGGRGRGEQATARLMDPKIEWVHPAVTHLPFDGVVLGLPAAVRAAFRQNEDGTGPRVSAETFLELGEGRKDHPDTRVPGVTPSWLGS
jgi:hypothetical protein